MRGLVIVRALCRSFGVEYALKMKSIARAITEEKAGLPSADHDRKLREMPKNWQN